MRYQFQHDLHACEGFGSPIDGNEGKESMFNLVPFSGGRRILSDRDGEVFLISEILELFLPEPISYSIRAAPISSDQYLLFAGIEGFAAVLPPPPDALDGKLSGIMINTNIDEATIVNQIVDAIGNRFA